MTASRVYVYALLGSRASVGRRRGTRIEVIPVGGMFAAVERLASRPPLSEAALRRQHEIVVELARVNDAVLPVRFGAFIDVDELAQVIRLRQDVLRRALQRVRGHDQMTIRLFGPARTRAVAPAAATGTAYLRSRAAAARPALTPAARAIIVAVSPVVSAQRIDAGRSGGVQATIDHLVRRRSVARYRRLVETCVARMDAPPVVAVSGPWPPFAFAPDIWLTDSEDATQPE